MEQVTFRACDYKVCPSATLTGNNVAKIALAIVALVIVFSSVNKAK